MKTIATSLLTMALSISSFAGEYLAAGETGSRSSEVITISPATLDSVTTLVNKSANGRNLQVKVIVNSTGGTTDVSPQKQIFLGLYSENEMFDLVGTYNIGSAFSVTSISRLDGGIYKITGELLDLKKPMSIIVDAVDAVNELKNMSCGEFEVCRTTKSIKIIKK
jgi:hypothetical protein